MKSISETASYAYFDTSVLVKRYVTEPGSLQTRRLLRRLRVVSSLLTHLEILSALQRRHSQRAIPSPIFGRLRRRVETDALSWDLVAVSDEMLARARNLLLQRPVRTLDAIHIASALLWYQEGVRLPFVSADTRQAEAACAAGLEVIQVI